jgi:hypothetical protein
MRELQDPMSTPRHWILAGALVAGLPRPVHAQETVWNDSRTLAVVERAVDRRSRRFADSGLTDYTAEARGYLTFLGQFGEGFPEPPRVVKVDQLAVEVLWKAPMLSKQRLIGQRDTLLLPAEIGYYRDRFGIVQNNFPDLIRMGDGRDVRDIPHPLSNLGLATYDYSFRDSIVVASPELVLNLYIIQVRPKDESQPGVIGAVFLDRDTGAVARMALTFTSHAFLDKRIERLSVVLENARIGAFWLPSHQEVEVVRQTTWLNFPARGIIRARWEVCCYELNVGLDSAAFAGTEFVRVPQTQLAQYPWQGGIVDSLPEDVRFASDEDARRVLQQAQQLVGVDALSRQLRGGALSAGRISDFLRVNRVEGVAVGAGVVFRLGRGAAVGVTGRVGFADERVKYRSRIDTRPSNRLRLTLFAERDHRDVGDMVETSLFRNTVASGAFARDFTNPYETRGVGVTLGVNDVDGVQVDITAAYETHHRLSVNASSLTGTFDPTIPAWSVNQGRLTIDLVRPAVPAFGGMDVGWQAELRGGLFTGRDTTIESSRPYFGRAFFAATMEKQMGSQRLLLSTTAAVVAATPDVPPQEYVFLGGPITAPGYGYHELTGEVGVTQHVEWQFPVPFPSVGLGKFGRSPPTATVAPFAHLAIVGNSAPFAPHRTGLYPSVGIATQLIFDLLRIQTARGLRDGRWTFSIDVHRQFWGIL